jgi:subtilisin-like proprotein convertase family protein
MQAIGRWLGELKKVALLLAAGLAAVAALGLASAASAAPISNTDGPITINDGSACDFDVSLSPGTATPYPSVISVDGLDSVTDVNVTLTGLSHTFPDDIGLLLVSPAGQSVILMTESGGNFDASGINLTFDDAASSALPDGGPLSSGTYQPTRGIEHLSCIPPSSFPATAPEGPYGSLLSVFNGSDPNGIWQLYVIDDTGIDTGSITGWSLDFNGTTPGDTTPPTVTATSPQATSPPTPPSTASKTANVTATFSEPVKNVTPSTFILERQIAVKKSPPKYVLVDATVSPVSPNADDSYVLDPVQNLPKGEYRATITTDVTDMADPANALEEPVVWTFKVEN